MEGWRQFKLGQEDRFWLRTEDNLLFFSCPARLNKAGCGRRQGSPLRSDRCRGAPKTRGLDRGPRRPEPCNYPGKRKTKGYERPKPLDIDRPSHGSPEKCPSGRKSGASARCRNSGRWPTFQDRCCQIPASSFLNRVDMSLRGNSAGLFLAEFRCRKQGEMRARMPLCVGVKEPEGVPERINMSAQFLHNARAELLAPKCGQTAKDSA